jgi:hypothetical protein
MVSVLARVLAQRVQFKGQLLSAFMLKARHV